MTRTESSRIYEKKNKGMKWFFRGIEDSENTFFTRRTLSEELCHRRVRSLTSYFTLILVMLIINIASLTSCWNFSYLVRRRVSLSFAFCHVLIKQILTFRSEGVERSAVVYWRESEWLHKAEVNPIDLVVIFIVCYIFSSFDTSKFSRKLNSELFSHFIILARHHPPSFISLLLTPLCFETILMFSRKLMRKLRWETTQSITLMRERERIRMALISSSAQEGRQKMS